MTSKNIIRRYPFAFLEVLLGVVAVTVLVHFRQLMKLLTSSKTYRFFEPYNRPSFNSIFNNTVWGSVEHTFDVPSQEMWFAFVSVIVLFFMLFFRLILPRIFGKIALWKYTLAMVLVAVVPLTIFTQVGIRTYHRIYSYPQMSRMYGSYKSILPKSEVERGMPSKSHEKQNYGIENVRVNKHDVTGYLPNGKQAFDFAYHHAEYYHPIRIYNGNNGTDDSRGVVKRTSTNNNGVLLTGRYKADPYGFKNNYMTHDTDASERLTADDDIKGNTFTVNDYNGQRMSNDGHRFVLPKVGQTLVIGKSKDGRFGVNPRSARDDNFGESYENYLPILKSEGGFIPK